jgi:hypothetical protein
VQRIRTVKQLQKKLGKYGVKYSLLIAGKSDPYVSYTRLGVSNTSKTKVIEKTLVGRAWLNYYNY